MRVALVYAGFAWEAFHTSTTIKEAYGLDPWFMNIVTILLGLGLLLVVSLSHFYELTPDGLKSRSGAVSRPATSPRRLRWPDLLIIALILILAVLYAIEAFLTLPATATTGSAKLAALLQQVKNANAYDMLRGGIMIAIIGVFGSRLAFSDRSQANLDPQALPKKSVAVLPFRNLSRDPDQEYFSEGITIEITSALANVPDLLVIGRVSAFKFKEQKEDLREIGHQLGTTHLIEGSVQKDGNRVRITAELIEAATGVCKWAERYNREFSDIFVVQEEIAHAIAAAMHVPLGLKQRMVRSSTKDTAAYEIYLRARKLIRARGLANLTKASDMLEQVVAEAPNFAPAWAMLGLAYALTPNFHWAYFTSEAETLRDLVKNTVPRAETAARQAIQLDPQDDEAYVALALALSAQGKFSEAEDNYRQARELDPNSPDVLHGYSAMLSDVGHLKAALAIRRQLMELEPFVPIYNWGSSWIMAANGLSEEALAILEKMPPDRLGRQYYITREYAAVGRYREAADALEQIGSNFGAPSLLNEAVRLLRLAPSHVLSAAEIPQLGILGFIYLYVGLEDRYLEFFECNAAAGYVCNGTAWLWHPSYSHLRKTERFKALVRSIGLEEYWRKRGGLDSESLAALSSTGEH